MINGLTLTPVDATAITLVLLQNSPYSFQLTGSRFFGIIDDLRVKNTNRDYDFFTEDNAATEAFLKGNGFTLVGRRNADYLGCCDVRCVYEKGIIQVQLVKNVDLKSQIQRSMKNRLGSGFNEFSKVQRKKLWRMMYDLASVFAKTHNHTFLSGNQPNPTTHRGQGYNGITLTRQSDNANDGIPF